MDIQRLAETLGIGAFVIAALTYLLRSIWGQMLSRDLEKFKTALRTAAFEQETRFARLHERRAEVIAELYKRLVWAHSSLGEMVSILQSGGEEERKKGVEKAGEHTSYFLVYFHENDIYFDQSLCTAIENLEGKFRSTWFDFTVFPDRKPASGKEWHAIWKNFTQEVPPLKREIQKRFRKLLGVEDEVPSD